MRLGALDAQSAARMMTLERHFARRYLVWLARFVTLCLGIQVSLALFALLQRREPELDAASVQRVLDSVRSSAPWMLPLCASLALWAHAREWDLSRESVAAAMSGRSPLGVAWIAVLSGLCFSATPYFFSAHKPSQSLLGSQFRTDGTWVAWDQGRHIGISVDGNLEIQRQDYRDPGPRPPGSMRGQASWILGLAGVMAHGLTIYVLTALRLRPIGSMALLVGIHWLIGMIGQVWTLLL